MDEVKEIEVIHEISFCVARMGLESDKKPLILANVQPTLHPYKKLTVKAASIKNQMHSSAGFALLIEGRRVRSADDEICKLDKKVIVVEFFDGFSAMISHLLTFILV